MATDAGNTIATVYYPKSGDLSVLYRVGQAVLLWPRVSGVKSTDLDTYDTSVKTIQPKDGTTQISDTSNVAAAWSVKGSGKSTRIFVQGTNDYLQETVWDGSDFDKEFKHIHDAADPAPPILVRKNTSIAAVSNQWDTTKKDGDQFDFTIFYQGTDNRIYFIQSPKPGSYTYPLPVTPELATEGTTIQAVQYSDADHIYVIFNVPNPDRFVRYKYHKRTQYNNLAYFSKVTPDFVYPDGIKMIGRRFATVRVLRSEGSPLEEYRFYAQLKDTSGKEEKSLGLVEYIGTPDSSEDTVTLVKGTLEVTSTDTNPPKDYTNLAGVCIQTTDKDNKLKTTIDVLYEHGTNIYFKSMEKASKAAPAGDSAKTGNKAALREVWRSDRSLPVPSQW